MIDQERAQASVCKSVVTLRRLVCRVADQRDGWKNQANIASRQTNGALNEAARQSQRAEAAEAREQVLREELQKIKEYRFKQADFYRSIYEIDEKISNLQELVGNLLTFCTTEEKKNVISKYPEEFQAKLNEEYGGEIYRKTIDIFRAEPEKSLDIQEIRKRLEAHGLKPNQKQVYNTL